MSIRVDQDVLRLQIAVCHALLLVQELQYQGNLGGVELRGGLVEASRPAQIRKDLAAGAVLQQHIQSLGVLEAGNHGGDEGVAGDGGEDVALVADVLDLLEADDVDLPEDLEREDLAGVLALAIGELDQPDARKGAGAQGLDQLEVVLDQDLGRVADRFVLRVDDDLVDLQRPLLGLPLGELALLVLALVHVVLPVPAAALARAVVMEARGHLVDERGGHGRGIRRRRVAPRR